MAAILILAALYLFSQLHPGHPMDEDFAVYLQQAIDIAHGHAFRDMGVVYSQDLDANLWDQGPLIYPPAVPLLLAPVVGLFGLNFAALKAAQLFMVLTAFALMAVFHRRLGFTLFEACAAIVVFSLLPETQSQINDIGSDLPFLLFLVVALLAAETQLAAPPEKRLRAAIVAGAAMFAAFDARTVAVALLPAAALTAIVRDRRQTRWIDIVVPAAAFAVLWLAQKLLSVPQVAYESVMRHKFFDVISNMRFFYWHLVGPWDHTALSGGATAVFLAAAALAALGVLAGLKRTQVTAWFCVVYLAMILALPNFDAGLRYLVPVLLFLGAFAARGAGWAAAAARLDERGIAACSTAAAGVLTLFMLTGLAAVRPLPYGALTPQSVQVFDFFTAHTDPGALVASRKSRAFHLFTQRRTIRPPVGALASEQRLSEWLAANRVDYLVVKRSPALTPNDFSDCSVASLCRWAADAVAPAFENADYQVFRLPRQAPQGSGGGAGG